MQTEWPEEGVTIGGPRPGLRCRSDLRGVDTIWEPGPRPARVRLIDDEYTVDALPRFDIFRYNRECFRVGHHVAVFFLPAGERPEKYAAECERWLRENGPEPVRLYLAQLTDQRNKTPCLIRIPADRVAEILGL